MSAKIQTAPGDLETVRAFVNTVDIEDGAEADAAAIETLRAAANRAQVALEFSADGAHLAPRAGGVDGALGRMLGSVHAAMHDGTWARLKACPWHTCHYAFYDNTKNRSG